MGCDSIRPKSQRMLEIALARGFRVDVESGIAYRPDGSVWKTGKNSNGYLQVQGSAAEFGEHFCVPLHKAVAFVKYGPSAFGGHSVHVRHKDGDKMNNKGANILLGTPQENNLDKPATVRSEAARKRAKTLGVDGLAASSAKAKTTLGLARMIEIGRKAAESSGSKILTDIEVAMIRKNATLPSDIRISQRAIANEFGVKQGTVCDILAGRCYGNVGLAFR